MLVDSHRCLVRVPHALALSAIEEDSQKRAFLSSSGFESPKFRQQELYVLYWGIDIDRACLNPLRTAPTFLSTNYLKLVQDIFCGRKNLCQGTVTLKGLQMLLVVKWSIFRRKALQVLTALAVFQRSMLRVLAVFWASVPWKLPVIEVLAALNTLKYS